MGGVDRQDQVLSCFPVMRRYSKSYKKLFLYVWHALYNSFVIWKIMTGKKEPFTDFRLNFVDQVLENVTLPQYPTRGRPSVGPVSYTHLDVYKRQNLYNSISLWYIYLYYTNKPILLPLTFFPYFLTHTLSHTKYRCV